MSVHPEATTETLMGYLDEALALVDVMVQPLVDHGEGGRAMRCRAFPTA
ncbi:hypothetical protein ACX3YC_20005 [Pseudomonas mohnii]|nr:hypothetical protein [Pseudomonas sp. MIL9]